MPIRVSIPHSGLRTIYRKRPYARVEICRRSPSHTVGSERPADGSSQVPFRSGSPSHTVGSEPMKKEPKTVKFVFCLHPTQWAQNKAASLMSFTFFAIRSPSHTVGSELQGGFTLRELIKRSPSHTVGSEPQITTLTKIRHINHFVKVAPFSNEVNFPKSEIMQS